MSNIRVGVSNKGILVALVVAILLLGGGGGYLLWRVNQQDTVAPTDSDASGCTVSRVSGDTCRARGTGECNEDEAGAGTLCCKPYKKTCTYTLKYVAGTGGTITGNATQNITSENISDGSLNKNTPEPSTVTATANSGYKFVKWSDNKTTAARKDEPKDATYTATFEALPVDKVTLTYTAGAGGKITGTTPQTIDKGANGTSVTATPDNIESVFVKWSDNKTTATRTDTNVQANATYTATFETDTPVCTTVMTYLKYSADENGTIQGNANQTYTDSCGKSTVVTAVAKDATRWKFSYWAITSTGQRDTSEQATANPRMDSVNGVNVDIKAIFVSTVTGNPVDCTGFTLTCGANRTINISWNSVNGATGYAIRVNVEPFNDWSNINGGDQYIWVNTNLTSRVVSNIVLDKRYNINVSAYDGPDQQVDFHPSCNMSGLGDVWAPSVTKQILCTPTGPGTIPETGIFDNSKHTVIFGFAVLVIGLGWTWLSTLPKKAYLVLSSTSSKMKEDSEKKRIDGRRSRLERKIK